MADRSLIGRQGFGLQSLQWIISMAIHALLLLGLAIYHFKSAETKKTVQVVSTVLPEVKQEEFIDLIDSMDKDVSLSKSLTLQSPAQALASVGSASSLQESLSEAAQVQEFSRSLGVNAMRPLSNISGKVNLGTEVSGLKGSNASGASDSGSVDRITLELLRQLEKNKLLVVWVMDSTESLKERRQKIIEYFDRIYEQLEKVGNVKGDVMLTAVVGFGKSSQVMTEKPTSDRDLIRKAVKDIKPDETGTENIFSAIKTAASQFRKFQTHGRRKLIVIGLTDEMGDDVALLDETVDLLRRNQASVYLLGPQAPFGRKELLVRWVDKPTGEAFMLPVERGPESLQVEHLSLPYWYAGPPLDLFPSGFGPYALTRLARDTGGIYFIYDDDSLPGPRFSNYDMIEYLPEYQDIAEYTKMLGEHPLRAAIINTARENRNGRGAIQPQLQFGPDNFQDQLTRAQQPIAEFLSFVDRALTQLRAVEKYRKTESSKRWQAHYDLLMGRLLASRVRCMEYQRTLASMKTNPKTPDGKDNSWRLIPDKSLAADRKDGAPAAAKKKTDQPATNVRKEDPKAAAKLKEEMDAAVKYLDRVIEEHTGTPWALLAQKEREAPFGFMWKSYYQPTQAEMKAAKQAKPAKPAEKDMKREEANKRVPKKI